MEKTKKVFVNVPTEVGQTEAEEIGVEHLLRNVRDASISTLTTEIGGRIQGMSLLPTEKCEMCENCYNG